MVSILTSMSQRKEKNLFRHTAQAVREMAEARKAASSREMSDEEFLRQSPAEVRAQPLPGRKRSTASSPGPV